jgi:hypothetical protein
VVLGYNLNACVKLLCSALQNVASFFAILRNKVEMVSRYAERTRIPWRPGADKSAFDIVKVKFKFRFCCVHQTCALWKRMHCTRMHRVKEALDSQGIKEIFRVTVGVQAASSSFRDAHFPI